MSSRSLDHVSENSNVYWCPILEYIFANIYKDNITNTYGYRCLCYEHIFSLKYSFIFIIHHALRHHLTKYFKKIYKLKSSYREKKNFKKVPLINALQEDH